MISDFMKVLDNYLDARDNVDQLGWQDKAAYVAECRSKLENRLDMLLTDYLDRHEESYDHETNRRYD